MLTATSPSLGRTGQGCCWRPCVTSSGPSRGRTRRCSFTLQSWSRNAYLSECDHSWKLPFYSWAADPSRLVSESNTLAPGSFHRSIPAEILREILIHVVAENPERSPSRLRALARVNRHFNVPATAEMWRSVSFHYEAKTTKFLAAAATRKERDEAMQTNFVCIHHQAADVARVVAACVGLRSLEISDSAVDFDFLSTLNASCTLISLEFVWCKC